MLDKKEVYEAVRKEIGLKSQMIQAAFDDLNSAVTDDSKSTAGDKHETGRAMIHLEQEKLSKQLTQVKLLNETFSQIKPDQKHTKTQFGSLISTNKGIFFFSVGLGKIKLDQKEVFCLTVTTPLGAVLIGKKVGDKISFNGTIEILDIQ